MSENFAKLLEESLNTSQFHTGAIVQGKIVCIVGDYAVVNAGLKSESLIPLDQFRGSDGQLEANVGDTVHVAIEMLEDGTGETRLSREKAKRAEVWIELEKAHTSGQNIIGVITGKVKGGFTVEINNVRAFLPGSLVDVRPVRDSSYLEGKELEFKIIKLDAKRNNIVVSRRSVVEDENSAERKSLLDNLQEGQEIKGIVKNLTDYGAFIDLGGVDGLLHVTDMSWKRVKHPGEVVNVGDEVQVVVLKYDRERQRVSLGLKQLGHDPWAQIKERYPVGTVMSGKVTNITDYGCFVEIEDGVEGLVHVSEMDWTNKNIHPKKVVQVGQEVNVKVLEIDEERRRVSLGIKQCADNPWAKFSEEHKKDEVLTGKIKSITDFGIFIGLEGGIDGLIHLSDISWTESPEDAIRKYKKGDEVSAAILAIDAERERISLSIKHLDRDAFGEYVDANPKGSIVKGKVVSVEANGATVELAPEIMGHLRSSEIMRGKVNDAREHIKEGDEIEAKVISVDKKSRLVNISIKAKETQEEAQALENFRNTEAVNTTLGDLLKEKMNSRDNES